MAHYRAHHATAAAARDAVAAAKTAIEAKWSTATETTGIDVGTVSPTVAVRIESTEDIPSTAALPETYSNAKMRITAIDGRGEYATGTMPKTQADTLISAASGTATFSSTYRSQALVKSRVAKSVQVTALDNTAAVLTGKVLQDLNTGKRYTCAAYTASAAGVHTVDVTETDGTDTNSVTHGSALTFLDPPSNIVGQAAVLKMLGFTVAPTTDMLDADGRAYVTVGALVVADSGARLFGDHTGTIDILRDPTDGLEYATSVELDEEVTFVAAPTAVHPTSVVTRVGGATVPAGSALTIVVGGVTYRYTLIDELTISDALLSDGAFSADELGAASNRDVGNILTLSVVPTNVSASATVATSVAAQVYPQPFLAQVVGDEVEWETRIYPTSDGRWASELYTLPPGS